MKTKFNFIRNLVAGTAIILALSACSDADMNMESGIGGDEYQGEDPYGDNYTDYGENQFISAAEAPVSTFSVDCDGASYTNMRKWLRSGQNPPAASVRVEEFLNYFTFDYPDVQDGENISLNHEIAICPWNTEHLLMRVGIKGKEIPEEQLPATNYVLLIDVSGSMESVDKLGILKSGFGMLVDELRPIDKVAIVVYSGASGVVLNSTYCEDANKSEIKGIINSLKAGGSTAGGAAITMAYDIAVENYIPDGNNRIILGTDGDFNVGISDTEELVALVESKRDQGIYMTVLGVGSGNLNDSMMEQIADNGNGNYEYLDSVEQLEKVFIHEKSKFYAVAKDCKIQVAFDPALTDQYRLIGYENRVLNNEDFENDEKDAGDMGVGQTVTALYEIIPVKDYPSTGTFASLDVRYKKPGEGESSILVSSEIDNAVTPIEAASDNMRFASSVAAFGMLLKGSEFAGTANKNMIKSLGQGALGSDSYGYRNEYLELVDRANIR
jgi:Ca-activated chloride channel family protein